MNRPPPIEMTVREQLSVVDDSYQPQLCFVVRTMPGHFSKIPALLVSIYSSRISLDHVRAILVASEGDTGSRSMLTSVAEFSNKLLAPASPITVSSIDATTERARFPLIENASTLSAGSMFRGDAGYIVTDAVIEVLIEEQKRRTQACDYVIVTNGDNLYSPRFVPAVMTAVKAGIDIVATHFSTRYFHDKGSFMYYKNNNFFGSGPIRTGRDLEFIPAFKYSRADLGAVAFSLEALQRLNIRFLVDRLRVDPTGKGIDFALADGFFFEKFKNITGVRSKIIPELLFVHQ